MDEQLNTAAIRARLEAATPGPWDYSDCEGELSVDAGTARTVWNNGIGRPPHRGSPRTASLSTSWRHGTSVKSQMTTNVAPMPSSSLTPAPTFPRY